MRESTMAGVLYRLDYNADEQKGGGVVYIGDDGVTGTDIGGGIFSGKLVRTDRVRGVVMVVYPQGGTLVTGQSIPRGGNIAIDFDMPLNFDNGQDITINISGHGVAARLTPISPIPIPSSSY